MRVRSVKSFEIVFDDNKTVYYPGQFITGRVILDLKDDMRVHGLRAFIRGVVKVRWTETKNTHTRLGPYSENYYAEQEYFRERAVLFGADRGGGSSQQSHYTLSAGYRDFPFEFQLPFSGIATSFEGKFGSIRYWLKAELSRPWSLDCKVKRAVTVICPVDINRPEYQLPVHKSVAKDLCIWCCASGQVSAQVQTDRRGYCPGESIAITADFENCTQRRITPCATLIQKQTYVAASQRQLTRTELVELKTLTGPKIQPATQTGWDAQLLRVPAITPSIANCSLIRVEYLVRMTLQIPGASNPTVNLPVVVGTVPNRHSHPLTGPTGALPPPYIPPPPPIGGPPTYAECINGTGLLVADDEEEDGRATDDRTLAEHSHFTPVCTYVHDYRHRPPPAYSKIDPHPSNSI